MEETSNKTTDVTDVTNVKESGVQATPKTTTKQTTPSRELTIEEIRQELIDFKIRF